MLPKALMYLFSMYIGFYFPPLGSYYTLDILITYGYIWTIIRRYGLLAKIIPVSKWSGSPPFISDEKAIWKGNKPQLGYEN